MMAITYYGSAMFTIVDTNMNAVQNVALAVKEIDANNQVPSKTFTVSNGSNNTLHLLNPPINAILQISPQTAGWQIQQIQYNNGTGYTTSTDNQVPLTLSTDQNGVSNNIFVNVILKAVPITTSNTTSKKSIKSSLSLMIGAGGLLFLALWFLARHKEMKS
ncbi:MAG: hypothetical protein M1542_08540 [Thermotogae bacterium]|jgi:hypothetical protein|nr:hypothetical protein [Thermotogota bacterium]